MERNIRIKDFFAFLKESRPDENTIDLVIEKLALEIQEERSLDNEINEKEYLESLLEIKNGPLINYLQVKRTGTRKESTLSFRTLMDLLVQDVRLHGLVTAQ